MSADQPLRQVQIACDKTEGAHLQFQDVIWDALGAGLMHQVYVDLHSVVLVTTNERDDMIVDCGCKDTVHMVHLPDIQVDSDGSGSACVGVTNHIRWEHEIHQLLQ